MSTRMVSSRPFCAISPQPRHLTRAAGVTNGRPPPSETSTRRSNRTCSPDGTLRKIPNVGPASTRVIMEVLSTGRSEIVERQIEASGRAHEIEKSRGLRDHFLTRAQVVAALADKTLRGPTLEQYRGDLQMHSDWSDGSQTLEEIVQTGLARGTATAP